MLPKVLAILLPTYNSSRFLKEQINSLLAQTYQEWILYVRDDGSSDSTLEILLDYKQQHSDKIFLIEDDLGSLGAKGSFVQMLNVIDADYYMFCDHDDVWLPDKVKISIDEAKSLTSIYGSKHPIVVHTDLKVVDQNLNVLNDSVYSYLKIIIPDKQNIYRIAASNTVIGCTMLINKAAKNVSLPVPPTALMHDWWIALIVCKLGSISTIPIPTALYRQHASNTVGVNPVSSSYAIDKIRKISTVIRDNYNVIKMLRRLPFYFNFSKYFFYKISIIFKKM